MTVETVIETSTRPASNQNRKTIWQRRLFVVIVSAVLTLSACSFLGLQFGSAEQVTLTLMSLSLIALLLRVFRSKGRFRFASLLLLTAFSAIVFRVVLQPLKRRSDQNAAIELVNRS
jgi:flagellar biosynthesis protein FlhB